jgi:SAM-dependent methyltransferase
VSEDDTANQWDAEHYDTNHSFVYEYGGDVVELLQPERDEHILDLGCGTGHLTNEISRSASVVGLDNSLEMVKEARQRYPELDFVCEDARDFELSTRFDAVFSNAVLHWISDQRAVIESVRDALKPEGRFVAELGGQGNVDAILSAAEAELAERGYSVTDPWYFPSLGEHASLLEECGFEVRYAALFDRPTELDGGDDGLRDWLEMFGDGLFAEVPSEVEDEVIEAVEHSLRGELYQQGTWAADYRRLRFEAFCTE